MSRAAGAQPSRGCSALWASRAAEEVIWKLRGDSSIPIPIPTHITAQARRASDECIFIPMGEVVERSATGERFVTPKRQ